MRGISFAARGQTHLSDQKMDNVLTASQDYLEDQMEDYDGVETFTFKINKIKTQQPLENYTLDTIAELMDKTYGDFSKDGEIRAVFIPGIADITDDILATHLPLCPPMHKLACGHFVCKNYVFIPAKNPEEDLKLITVHEILHALGLGHQSSRKYVMYKDLAGRKLDRVNLSDDEKHWLSCHPFFTGQVPVASMPKIDEVHLPNHFLRKINMGGYVKVRVDFMNAFPLHQVYILQSDDGILIDHDKMSDNPFAATFDVRRTTNVIMRILDKQGNFVSYLVDLSDFDRTIVTQIRVPEAPSLFLPQTVRTWGNIKTNK